MKAIRVMYRATFQQPLGKLNPLGARFSCDIEVEVYPIGPRWRARRPNTSACFEELGEANGFESMRQIVEQSFARRVKPWTMHDKAGQPIAKSDIGRVLADGRVEIMEPEDYSHIQDTSQLKPNNHTAMALCGGLFKYSAFASTLPNAPAPTCARCAELMGTRREPVSA